LLLVTIQEESKQTAIPTATAAQLEWVKKQAPLFVPPAEDPPAEAQVQDLLADASMWKYAGFGIGEEATYLMLLSLKALAVSKGAEVRFWGKLVTRSGDYFIAETKTTEFPEDITKFEMEGTDGPNKYTYLVSKSPSDAASWVELPHVTPAQIVAARQIKRFLTGDLAAPVSSFPPFPGGKEENLMRAMIAQITSETVLSLSGLLKAGEDEVNEILPNDEDEAPPAKSIDELKELSCWVHAELDINAVGRTQKTPLPEGDDGEPIEPEEPDEAPKLPLESIDGDLEAEKPTWVLRTCPSGAGFSVNSVVVAKSLKWPGACAVVLGNKVTNVYMGFGVAKSSGVYQPPAPKAVQAEWVAPEEEEGPGGFPLEKDDVTVKPEEPTEDE
jgi:radial spoke head protein 4A